VSQEGAGVTAKHESIHYEDFINHFKTMRHHQETGEVFVRGADLKPEMTHQGLTWYYLHPKLIGDTVVQDWQVFIEQVDEPSGKHIHQGGLVIYILEGEGYTVMNGERYDWGPGDLIVMPILPGGVEHQHFSKDSSKPCKWMAFIPWPTLDYMGSEATQLTIRGEGART
jgi:mannose-6-phosphate isomerase-like protein (cupin superfamily)